MRKIDEGIWQVIVYRSSEKDYESGKEGKDIIIRIEDWDETFLIEIGKTVYWFDKKDVKEIFKELFANPIEGGGLEL